MSRISAEMQTCSEPMHKSFNILASEYRPMVVAYLHAMGADVHLAEDLTQEAFVAAYQSLDKFEQGGNFGSWIRGIARNKALMHWRAAATRPPLSADARSMEGVDEVFETYDRQGETNDWWGERQETLKMCVTKLSTSLRRAIEQVYTHGDTLEEAAAVLKSSPPAIGQRLSRARRLIRECVTLQLNSKNNS